MALTFNENTAHAVNAFWPVAVDNVYKKHLFWARLSRPGFKMTKTGNKCQVTIINTDAGAGGAYDKNETLTQTPTDETTSAVFEWKRFYVPMKISHPDLSELGPGPTQMVDFIKTKMKIMELRMRKILTLSAFSDGTGATGLLTTKQWPGILALLDTNHATTNYGGFNSGDVSTWKPSISSNSGTNRTPTLTRLETVYRDCSDGDEQPTLLVVRSGGFSQIWNQYQPFQRVASDAASAKLGFPNTPVFNKAAMIVDDNAPANKVVMLNEEYYRLAILKGNEFRRVRISNLEDTDAMLERLHYSGAIVATRRERHGLFADSSESSL